jgi:hypothetical protein
VITPLPNDDPPPPYPVLSVNPGPAPTPPAGGGMTNPMTAVGDLIVGGTAGAPTPLAIGEVGDVLTVASGAPAWSAPATPTVYAPTDATYIVQTASSGLSAEQALGALGTGLLKNTTTTGALSIAAGTDLPDHTHAAGQGANIPAGSVTGTALVSAAIGTTVQAYDADTAKLDVDQTWTGKQTFPLSTNYPVFQSDATINSWPAFSIVNDEEGSKTTLRVFTSQADGDCYFSPGIMVTSSYFPLSLGNGGTGATALVSAGITNKVGTVSLTGQTATITTANLYASAPAGFYRASVYVVATASVVGTLTVKLGWTDAYGAQTSTVITTGAIAAGAFATATLPINTTGTNNITYATVRGGTSMTYNLYIRLEQIS